MRFKKWIIGLVAVVVCAALIVTAVLWFGRRGDQAMLEQVKRAGEARLRLCMAFDGHPLDIQFPDYLVGCHIDEKDLKLHIYLHERDMYRTEELDAAMGAYADAAVYEPVPESRSQLEARAADLLTALTEKGYPVQYVNVTHRGTISVRIKDYTVAYEAAAWCKTQTQYPFDAAELTFPCKDIYCTSSSADSEAHRIVHEARDALIACLREAGGYHAYKDYYLDEYINIDNTLHLVFKETVTKEQQTHILRQLKEYEACIVVEYGYSEAEAEGYTQDFIEALNPLQIFPKSYGVTGDGIPHFYFPAGEASIVLRLMNETDVYPFGNTKFGVWLQ